MDLTVLVRCDLPQPPPDVARQVEASVNAIDRIAGGLRRIGPVGFLRIPDGLGCARVLKVVLLGGGLRAPALGGILRLSQSGDAGLLDHLAPTLGAVAP